MPWFSPWSDFSDLIKKKVCRYLLQRYMGNFMEEKLTLEQLNIDISNGTGTVHDVNLYCESLNELCEAQEWGIEVTSGRIGAVTVSVPWNALMTEDSHIEIRDLFIAIRPLARVKEGTSMLESMWSSMSSSMQLAQECLEKEGGVTQSAQTSHVMEGLERFAQTIDNVLNRVKARLRNTEIRLEYVPPETDRGVALIIKIENLEYQNEAGDDSNDKEKSPDYENEEQTNKKSILLSTYATHHIVMEGISFYTEEFRIVGSEKKSPDKKMFNEQFYSTINELPETEQFYARQNQSSESDRAESDLEDENSIEIYRTEQILLGRLSSRQEIRIKMKQIENVSGPKVELELTLGAITLFLSPRQMHSLLLLSDALLYDPVPEQKIIQKPKHSLESHQGDSEFRKDSGFNANAMTGGIGFNQGWSGEPADNFESLPFTSSNNPTVKDLSDSFVSSSSSMTSSMGSSASQSTQNSQRIQRRRPIDFETNADISKFNLRIACCALVILHEDILVECSSPLAEAPLSEQSVRQLKLLSDHFFETTGAMGVGLGANEMAHAGKLLDAACRKNNLRLLLAPIILEGEEQRNPNGSSLRIGISIARVDLREVLGNFSVPLIEFCRKDNNGSLPKRPEVTINYKQIQQTIRGSSGKRFAPPKSDVKILVGSFLTEVDISIVDRLSAILNPSPFSKPHKSTVNPQKRETKIEIHFEGSSIDLKLRFPIADLRPIHDPQRVPWWERNVRADYLLLSFQQILINFSPPCKFEIQANEISIFYCESEKNQPIPIGKSVMVEKTGTRFTQSVIDYPKIVIELPSDRILLESCQSGRASDDSDSGPTSGESIGVNTPKEEDATPFSSKRVCRESDTPHKKQATENPETLIIPGDKAEMDSFCENSMKTAKIQIRICLPVVSLQLRSKHLYEIIYNRINCDLLLWEPCAPAAAPTPQINKMSNSLLNAGMMDSLYVPFTMCKSGINYDSSSSAATSESESENDIYYSISDKQSKKPVVQVTPPVDNSSALAFQLNIGQGILTTYAPVRDSQNHVIPGQLGEFVIKIKSTYLFSVSGYRGNSTLNYFCLQSNAAELYHYGLIPVPTSDPPLRIFGCMLPSHVQSTFYPIPKDLVTTESTSSREMISLALQIKTCPDQRRKRIRVAAGIQSATLRHNLALPQHTWLIQLLDMFDVEDYPVQGYIPFGVVTELHLHLWDCAIDYRPLHFPYRAVATLGTFMISSNIAAASTGCTLRFIAEDCTLSLAPQIPLGNTKNRSENKITALPSSELICIVDLGLFEISLRLNDKPTPSFPKFDLRASINDVHLRTCSDSGNAFAQFIAYLAAEGDLDDVKDDLSEDEQSLTMSEGETELLPIKPGTPNTPAVTKSQQQRVNTLMAEAMEESLRIITTIDDKTPISDLGVDVFFFPDETNLSERKKESLVVEEANELEDYSLLGHGVKVPFNEDAFAHMYDKDGGADLKELLDFETSVMASKSNEEEEVEEVESLPQVADELGKIPSRVLTSRKISSDTDDDFCFIAEEEKVHRLNYAGQDVSVTEDPIRIVDNHFSIPIGKQDLLQAPKDFPMAVERYTLCEMTLAWHLYGGNDFPTKEEAKNVKTASGSKKKTSMSEAYKMGVSYSKGSPSVVLGSNPYSKLTWKTKGGVGRKHDVLMEIQINKVRFSHETYPTNTEQASRQVLLVTELEIRDKLTASNINKFLYHPAVGPKTIYGTQHMIAIKALHLRPDPLLPTQECCLRVSLLPLRLNIDQDSLLFLVSFFSEFGGSSVEANSQPSQKSHVTPPHQPPVMMVELPEAAQELQARKMISDNLLLLIEEEERESECNESISDAGESSPLYFRNVVFGPDVPIRLDYQGKRVELSHGPLAGLLMGLGQLQCSEIRLKRISHRHGILGFDRLLNFLLQEWLQDIKRNQLPSILGGFGPMYSFVQLFQGIRDLFWLPIEQYQKDGRIVRGLQRGAQSFTARTALAALEITTKIIHLLQITAETAYDMVSPGPSVRRGRNNKKGKRKRFNPPKDIRAGVASAYQIVRDGIGETAHQIVDVATIEHDQKGYTGAVGAVVRQIPPTFIRPLVLATQATSKVLGGVRNQLVPDARIEAKDKWKDEDEI